MTLLMNAIRVQGLRAAGRVVGRPEVVGVEVVEVGVPVQCGQKVNMEKKSCLKSYF